MKEPPKQPMASSPNQGAGRGASKRPARETARRMRRPERKALVLTQAAGYFAEHGLNAQTRAIAEACGVSQRLL
jgi:AcrR family transcriptional regulator